VEEDEDIEAVSKGISPIHSRSPQSEEGNQKSFTMSSIIEEEKNE